MTRIRVGVLAVAAMAVLDGAAQAQLKQLPEVGAAPGQQQMPGINVGRPLLINVGTVFPKAVPAAGGQVGTTPGKVPGYSPQSLLPGAGLDRNAVVGPLPRGTLGPNEPSLWGNFVDRFGGALGLVRPEPRSPVWTPGISRRNREREKEKLAHWQRD